MFWRVRAARPLFWPATRSGIYSAIKKILQFFSYLIVLFFISTAHCATLLQVKAKILDLTHDLHDQQSSRSQSQQSLEQSETLLAQLTLQYQKTQQQLQQQQAILNDLNQQQTADKINLDSQQAQLAAHLRAAYRLGQEDYLKILLNQENPALTGRNLMYYRYLIQYRVVLIKQISITLKKLHDTAQAINQRTHDLLALQTQQQQQMAQIRDQRKLRQQALQQINTSILTKNQQLTTLLADKQGLENVVQRIETPNPPPATTPPAVAAATSNANAEESSFPKPHLAITTPFSTTQGKLRWPTPGKIIQRYNSTIAQSELKLNGVLISAPQGQQVYAIAPGRVAFAQWMSGYGLLLIIDHGGGYMSLYGRNGTLYKKVGDAVTTNDLIASVGDSGGYNQPGLYFAIRHQGKAVDPANWCR